MTREELIILVQKIQSAEESEQEIDSMIESFESNVPDPNAVDYLFNKAYELLTSEEIVDKALAYKRFTL